MHAIHVLRRDVVGRPRHRLWQHPRLLQEPGGRQATPDRLHEAIRPQLGGQGHRGDHRGMGQDPGRGGAFRNFENGTLPESITKPFFNTFSFPVLLLWCG